MAASPWEAAGTLRPVGSIPLLLPRARRRGQVVLACYEHSPAHRAGIRAGWSVLRVGRLAATNGRVARARMRGARSIRVANSDDRVFELAVADWPFGLVLATHPMGALREQLLKGRFDEDSLEQLWRYGVLAPFGDLVRPLTVCIAGKGGLSQLTGFKVEKVRGRGQYRPLLYLALAYAQSGRPDEAERALDRANDPALGDGGNPSLVLSSLHAHVRALVAEARGDRAEAVREARAAHEFSPDLPVTRRTMARLGAWPAVPEATPERFAPLYDLPARDPVCEIEGDARPVSLAAELAAMGDDQFLVVFVLGGYRSNFYYNLDIVRLAQLHRAYPGVVAAVHVVVEGDYALDKRHRRRSEGVARRFGLPLRVLHDENGTLARTLRPRGSPARYILDRKGRVLSTARLEEEEGFWQAVGALDAGQCEGAGAGMS